MNRLKDFWFTVGFVAIPLLLLAGVTPSVHGQSDRSKRLKTFTHLKQTRTTGKLRPFRNLTIKAKLSENVDTFPVPEGRSVRKNQVILQFDTTTHKIRLNRTRHRMKRARHQKEISRKMFERKKTLLERDLISQSEYDQAELEFKQARENLAIARSDYQDAQREYGYTDVVSPFPGILDRHLVELGEQVRRGQDLLKLLQLDPIKIEFELTPEERNHVSEGDTIYVSVRNGTRPARVTRLSHDVDEGDGLYSLTARLSNDNHNLIPGRTVDIRVPLYRVENAVRIPLNYIDRSTDRPRLILKNPETGKFHKTHFTIVDYQDRFLITRRNWPKQWLLVPGSVYTKTEP